MSIRLRFTLLYNAILALTLLLFGVTLYVIQAQTTLNTVKREVLRSSETLGAAVLQATLHPGATISSTSNGPPTPPVGAPPAGDGVPAPPPGPLPGSTANTDQAFLALPEREIVRVLDGEGQWLASPYGRPDEALPLSAAGLQALQAQQAWWEQATVGTEEMLIYSRPILAPGNDGAGQSSYIVQVARALTEWNNALKTLIKTLVGAGLVIVLLAFGIGWVLAGLTLRPIQQMTQTVQRIGEARDFTQRIDYQGPPDEVGTLATTFNAMLARLQEAYQQVAHALAMQRNFVADVSHELRTPLTTVRGNLALLRRRPALPSAEQADILNDLEEESERLIRLVNALLVLARADAGRALTSGALPILPILQELCRQSQTLDPTRRLTLNVPPLTIQGDKDAFKQVLLIVLDNALKHGQGDVLISAAAVNQQIEIWIQDHGPGIPATIVEHLFDRFYRGVAASAHQGFGLGLAIAKTLVEAQQGTIAIASSVGVGTTVRLQFPVPAS